MPGKRIWGWTFLAVIMALGAFVRIEYNEVTVNSTSVQGDAYRMVSYAYNIAYKGIYSKETRNPIPDAYYTPGYPLFLAAQIRMAHWLETDPYEFSLLAQVVAGTLTILLTFMVGCFFLPQLVALVPAALVAFSPHLIGIGQVMLTETLFGLLLALTLLIFCTSTRKPDTPAFILLGICLAASWMVNPTALLLPAIFATLALWGNSPSTSELPVLRKPMILVCIFLPLMLVLGGWSLRTAVTVPDRGLDSASRLLMNLNVGMHETFHDRWRADKRDPNNPATLTAAEIGSSYAKFIEVWSRNFRENPVDMTVWYLFKKPYDLWGWDVKIGLYDIYIYPIEYSLYHKKAWANITHQAMKLMHLPILALALLGVCSIRYIHDKGRVPFIAVVAVTAYFTAVYSATQADPRYSFPLRPELYLCATVGLLQLSRLTKRRFFLRRSQAI